MTWYEKIKDLREKAGLTQVELGRKVGRTESYISQLERGRFAPPKPGLQEKFADAFELTLLQFLNIIHSREGDTTRFSGIIQIPIKGIIENMTYREISSIETVNVPEVLIQTHATHLNSIVAVEVKDDTFLADGIKPDTFLIILTTNDLIDGGTYVVLIDNTVMLRKVLRNGVGFYLVSKQGKYALMNNLSVTVMGRVLCSQNIQIF